MCVKNKNMRNRQKCLHSTTNKMARNGQTQGCRERKGERKGEGEGRGESWRESARANNPEKEIERGREQKNERTGGGGRWEVTDAMD